MPRHAHVFPDPARSRTIADGTVPPGWLGTVRGTLPMHVVFLHQSLKPFAFGAANHIHEIARLKLRHVQIHFALGRVSPEPKLARKSLRFDAGPLCLGDL